MTFMFILYFYFCTANFFADAMRNGEYHPITESPYVTQIRVVGDSEYRCGAAILSPYWVISAAHCVFSEETIMQIATGTSSGTSLPLRGKNLINVEKIFISGDHEPQNFVSDLCLLKLEAPIKFNQYQQPIQITKLFPKVGDTITVTGYGYHRKNVFGSTLRSGQQPVAEHKYCNDVYQELYGVSITDKRFCTHVMEVETMPGDSGSPAVWNNKLVGVMSTGSDNQTIDVFTKIPSYYEWIMQTTGIKYDD